MNNLSLRRKISKRCGQNDDDLLGTTQISTAIPENHEDQLNHIHFTVAETGEEYALVQKGSSNKNTQYESERENSDHKDGMETTISNLGAGGTTIPTLVDNGYITPKLQDTSKNHNTDVEPEFYYKNGNEVVYSEVKSRGSDGEHTAMLDEMADDMEGSAVDRHEHPDGLVYVELQFPDRGNTDIASATQLHDAADPTIYSEVTASVP